MFYFHKQTTKPLNFLLIMIQGFRQIFLLPITNFFIIFVITFTLFVPIVSYVLWKNVNALSNIWNQSAEISLYLKKNVSAKSALNLSEKLKLNTAIMDLKLITPDEGMKIFTKNAEFGEILLGFKKNPLPNVIIIYPKLNELSQQQLATLIYDLKNIPEVEVEKTNVNWIENSYRLLNLWKYLSFVLVFLSVASILVFCSVAYVTPQIIMNKTKAAKHILQYQCFWHSLLGGLFAIMSINFILTPLTSLGFLLQKLGIGFGMVFILTELFLTMIILKFALKNPI